MMVAGDAHRNRVSDPASPGKPPWRSEKPQFCAATDAESLGTQFGVRHGPVLRAIGGHLASRKAAVNSRSVAVEPVTGPINYDR